MAFLEIIPGLSRSRRAKSGWPFPKRRGPLFGLLVLVLSFATFDLGHAQESKEYQLKAAFLFNFVQFVKWPPDSFTNDDAPFCIGILGDDPFGAALEETIRGETIDNHRMTVARARRMEDLKDCQMIFVSRSEEGRVGEILSQIGTRPILTVSEVGSFAQDGGDIDFYLSEGKVRFEINPQSAQRCGLRISSQLLSLGKIVKPESGGN